MSTTVTSPASSTAEQTVPHSRVIMASLIGTTIEFYDFYIYATAAVAVFPALFFTGEDDTTKLLASMATFGAAFVGTGHADHPALLPGPGLGRRMVRRSSAGYRIR